MAHTAVSGIGGLMFFLGSLHPFTRGVSTTFVRSFLSPSARVEMRSRGVAAQGASGNALPGFGDGPGGSHRGAALRSALAGSTHDRYSSSEFLDPTMDIWNWPQWLVDWGKESLRWQLARPYGMFIRMTGTNGVRPELAIEAAVDAAGPWMELPFRYKPTDATRSLPWVSPHNPRMD